MDSKWIVMLMWLVCVTRLLTLPSTVPSFQIMSSKRKSPPTKLDGSNGIGKTQEDDAEIDLSTRSSSDIETSEQQRTSPEPNSEVHHRNQLNGGKVKRRGGDIQVSVSPSSSPGCRFNLPLRLQSLSQAYFHQHHSHALQNLLSKRRKSENFDNVPSIHSPLNHSPHRDELSHNNNQVKSESSVKHNLMSELDETRIKCEPSDFDSLAAYHNNNHGDVLGSSKKTMNDVLKLLTNKMRGSTLKGSAEQDFENKM